MSKSLQIEIVLSIASLFFLGLGIIFSLLHLFELGILKKHEKDEISRLRNIRNKFMHEIRFIQFNDANRAFEMALKYIKKRMHDYNMKKINE